LAIDIKGMVFVTPSSITLVPQSWEAIIAVAGIPRIIVRTSNATNKLFIRAKYNVKPAPKELNWIGLQHTGNSLPA
jgi:hypothetical protein